MCGCVYAILVAAASRIFQITFRINIISLLDCFVSTYFCISWWYWVKLGFQASISILWIVLLAVCRWLVPFFFFPAVHIRTFLFLLHYLADFISSFVIHIHFLSVWVFMIWEIQIDILFFSPISLCWEKRKLSLLIYR